MTLGEKQLMLSNYLVENRTQLSPGQVETVWCEANEFLNGAQGERSYYTDDALLHLKGEDLFKFVADYIAKRVEITGKTILDVAAGIHCLSSVELTNKGATVVAMDPLAAPKYNNGFGVMKCSFNRTIGTRGVDLVTCIRGGDCWDEVMIACISDTTKFVIVFPNNNDVSAVGRLSRIPDVQVEKLNLSIPYIVATNL